MTVAASLGDRDVLAIRARRVVSLLRLASNRSPFYRRKFQASGISIESLRMLEDLPLLPLTTKTELMADQAQNAPFGTVHTEPIESFIRYFHTSSTTGSPLRWPDTHPTWQWMLNCWKEVYRAAYIERGERVFFPFSFGPYVGFWAGFEAGCEIGLQCVPGGGMSTRSRLSLIDCLRPTVVCCTPTYALRMAEVAAEEWPKYRLQDNAVRIVLVAGEPGGSTATTRHRIESQWGARVIDHYGLTEVGPVAYECWESPGTLHLNENEYVCEVLDPATGAQVPDGRPGELVVTNLGRTANPVIRYRTGDVVITRSDPCSCGRQSRRLHGGVITRTDDMVNIRGVNLYPGALESVIRRFTEVVEFRSTVWTKNSMKELDVEVELTPGTPDPESLAGRLASAIPDAIGLAAHVAVVPHRTLPRFELKAKRFIVKS